MLGWSPCNPAWVRRGAGLPGGRLLKKRVRSSPPGAKTNIFPGLEFSFFVAISGYSSVEN